MRGRAHAASADQGRCRRSRGRSHRLRNGRSVSRTALRSAFARPWCSMRPSSAICCRSSAPSTASAPRPIAETGEPHAQPSEPKPHCVQSFTYVFGLERRPQGERHVIERPARYEFFRASQPYSLTHRGARRRDLRRGERLAELQGVRDHARHQGRLVDLSPPGRQRAVRLGLPDRPVDVQLARQRLPGSQHHRSPRDARWRRPCRMPSAPASGFLHWLQTEAPAEGDRLGAPELKLRPDIMGTADGLAKFPYIRESRRIKALRTVVEQDVSAHFQDGPIGCPLRGFGRRRLVPDRHPSRRAGRRRHQLPHAPVSNSARRPHPRSRSQPDRRGQEHRHDPHHQWLLPPASRRVEHRRGGRARWRRSACSMVGCLLRFTGIRSFVARFNRACLLTGFLSPGPSTRPWVTGSLLSASGAQWRQAQTDASDPQAAIALGGD